MLLICVLSLMGFACTTNTIVSGEACCAKDEELRLDMTWCWPDRWRKATDWSCVSVPRPAATYHKHTAASANPITLVLVVILLIQAIMVRVRLVACLKVELLCMWWQSYLWSAVYNVLLWSQVKLCLAIFVFTVHLPILSYLSKIYFFFLMFIFFQKTQEITKKSVIDVMFIGFYCGYFSDLVWLS